MVHNTKTSGAATSAVVSQLFVVPELPTDAPYPAACQFCAEEWSEHPEWEIDDAVITFGGALYCGFHGYGFLYDRAARLFKEMS